MWAVWALLLLSGQYCGHGRRLLVSYPVQKLQAVGEWGQA